MSDESNEWSTYRFSNDRPEESPNDQPEESERDPSVRPASDDLTTSWQSSAPSDASPAPPKQPEPKFLGMAVSAARSMAKFAATGFRPVTKDVHFSRVAECNVCEHRDGSWCKLCGCLADKKAWVPHEDCPIGRWPQ